MYHAGCILLLEADSIVSKGIPTPEIVSRVIFPIKATEY